MDKFPFTSPIASVNKARLPPRDFSGRPPPKDIFGNWIKLFTQEDHKRTAISMLVSMQFISKANK